MKRRPPPQADTDRTIRASEVAAYLYCERAWWFERQGRRPAPSPAMDSGLAWHRRHGRRVLMAAGLRAVGWILLMAAVATAAFAAEQWIG